MTPHTDGKRRKMKMKKLTAVALTSRGANQHAHVTFFKSEKGSETKIEKRMALVSMEVLHTHAVTIDDWAKMNKGGSTGWVDDHDHPFVIGADGSIEIGAAKGHTHAMLKSVDEILKNGISEQQAIDLGESFLQFAKAKPAADNGNPQSGNEDITMTDAEKVALKKAQDELALNKTALALAIAMGSMNDGQRAYHKNLDEAGQAEFLGKSVEDREAIVKAAEVAAKSDNPVVYKSHKGVEFFKNDDQRMVEMAKDGDIRDAQMAKQAEKIADDSVAKRATELFKNLSGEAATHNALLKAVDGIEGDELRKNVMATLAASDAGIGAIVKEHGHQDLVLGDGDAEAQLETLAKKYVQDNPGTDFYDAYHIVSEANAGLLNKAVGV